MKRIAGLGILGLATILAGCGSGSSSSSTTTPLVMSPASGATLPDATVGTSYSQTFSISSGGTGPFALLAQGTPSGLTFAAVTSYSGTLSGVPTQSGQGVFALQVIDASNTVTDLSYVLTIKYPGASTLTISPATLSNGTVASSYSQALVVTGGTSPYTWTLSAGSLPPGLALGASTTASNTIGGTPTTAGTYSFTVSVTDATTGTSQQGTVTFTVTIS